MSSISQWSTLICLSSAACVIIELMLPSGKMEKMLRLVLRLFVLVSLVAPLAKGFKKIDFKWNIHESDPNQITDFVKSIEEQTETLAQDNIKGIVRNILRDMGIKSEKTEIFMDTSQENCISISKCRVYIPKDTKISGLNNNLTKANLVEIKRELEKRLSIETEVIMTG